MSKSALVLNAFVQTQKRHVLSALDPDQLCSADLMDISGLACPGVNFTSLANEAPVSSALMYGFSTEWPPRGDTITQTNKWN